MKHEEETNFYEADEGNFIIRISDRKIMGDNIYIGKNDSIDYYKEEPYTEESRKKFFATIGVEDPKAKPEPEKQEEKDESDTETEEQNGSTGDNK